MSRIVWDAEGERKYETGTDHGVIFPQDGQGGHTAAAAWNGLTSVTESPSGAEANPVYADNIKYLNLVSVEEYAASIEAYTYPTEFEQCDGSAEPVKGVHIGQQPRKKFDFSWRTRVGNDLVGDEFGYKIHLAYNCQAAPTEKAYNTVNDSPEPATFSWELSTTPVDVGEVNGIKYKPTACITIDSTDFTTTEEKARLAAFEDYLYGTENAEPAWPTPAQVFSMLGVVTANTGNSNPKPQG